MEMDLSADLFAGINQANSIEYLLQPLRIDNADNRWAIMYDISPVPPDNPDRVFARRYELDLIVSEGVINPSADRVKWHSDNLLTSGEYIIRVGYKPLPSEISIPEQADFLVAMYGGEIAHDTLHIPDMRTIIFHNSTPGGREAARRLMLLECFTLD